MDINGHSVHGMGSAWAIGSSNIPHAIRSRWSLRNRHPRMLPNCSSLYISVKAPKVDEEVDEEEGHQMSSVKDTVFRELPGLIMESITKDSAANAQSICEAVVTLCAVAKLICSNGEVFQAALLAFGVNSKYKREWLEMQTAGHLSDPPTSDRVLFNHICNRLSDAFKEIQLGYDIEENNYNHSPNDAKPPRDRPCRDDHPLQYRDASTRYGRH